MLNLILHALDSLLSLFPAIGPPLGSIVGAVGTGLHYIGQGVIG